MCCNSSRKELFLARLGNVLHRPRRRSYRHTTVALVLKRRTPSPSNPNRIQLLSVALTTICQRRTHSFDSVSKLKPTLDPARSATSFASGVKRTAGCTPSNDLEYLSAVQPIAKRNWKRFAKWNHCLTIPIVFVFIKRGRKINFSTFSSSCARPA